MRKKTRSNVVSKAIIWATTFMMTFSPVAQGFATMTVYADDGESTDTSTSDSDDSGSSDSDDSSSSGSDDSGSSDSDDSSSSGSDDSGSSDSDDSSSSDNSNTDSSDNDESDASYDSESISTYSDEDESDASSSPSYGDIAEDAADKVESLANDSYSSDSEADAARSEAQEYVEVAQDAYDSAVEDQKSAQDDYDKAEEAYEAASDKKAAADAELDAATEAVEKAQAELDALEKNETSIAEAIKYESDIEKAKEALETAKANEATAKANSEKAKEEYDAAKAAAEEASGKKSEADGKVESAQKDLKDAQDNVDSITKEKEAAEKAKDEAAETKEKQIDATETQIIEAIRKSQANLNDPEAYKKAGTTIWTLGNAVAKDLIQYTIYEQDGVKVNVNDIKLIKDGRDANNNHFVITYTKKTEDNTEETITRYFDYTADEKAAIEDREVLVIEKTTTGREFYSAGQNKDKILVSVSEDGEPVYTLYKASYSNNGPGYTDKGAVNNIQKIEDENGVVSYSETREAYLNNGSEIKTETNADGTKKYTVVTEGVEKELVSTKNQLTYEVTESDDAITVVERTYVKSAASDNIYQITKDGKTEYIEVAASAQQYATDANGTSVKISKDDKGTITSAVVTFKVDGQEKTVEFTKPQIGGGTFLLAEGYKLSITPFGSPSSGDVLTYSVNEYFVNEEGKKIVGKEYASYAVGEMVKNSETGYFEYKQVAADPTDVVTCIIDGKEYEATVTNYKGKESIDLAGVVVTDDSGDAITVSDADYKQEGIRTAKKEDGSAGTLYVQTSSAGNAWLRVSGTGNKYYWNEEEGAYVYTSKKGTETLKITVEKKTDGETVYTQYDAEGKAVETYSTVNEGYYSYCKIGDSTYTTSRSEKYDFKQNEDGSVSLVKAVAYVKTTDGNKHYVVKEATTTVYSKGTTTEGCTKYSYFMPEFGGKGEAIYFGEGDEKKNVFDSYKADQEIVDAEGKADAKIAQLAEDLKAANLTKEAKEKTLGEMQEAAKAAKSANDDAQADATAKKTAYDIALKKYELAQKLVAAMEKNVTAAETTKEYNDAKSAYDNAKETLNNAKAEVTRAKNALDAANDALINGRFQVVSASSDDESSSSDTAVASILSTQTLAAVAEDTAVEIAIDDLLTPLASEAEAVLPEDMLTLTKENPVQITLTNTDPESILQAVEEAMIEDERTPLAAATDGLDLVDHEKIYEIEDGPTPLAGLNEDMAKKLGWVFGAVAAVGVGAAAGLGAAGVSANTQGRKRRGK